MVIFITDVSFEPRNGDLFIRKKKNWLHFCETALWKFLSTRVSQLRYRDGVDFFQWCLPSILATELFIICLFVKLICLNSFNKYTVYLFLNGDWTFWIFKLIWASYFGIPFFYLKFLKCHVWKFCDVLSVTVVLQWISVLMCVILLLGGEWLCCPYSPAHCLQSLQHNR